jgi:hypothetical protein
VAGFLWEYGPQTLCQQGQNPAKKKKEKKKKEKTTAKQELRPNSRTDYFRFVATWRKSPNDRAKHFFSGYRKEKNSIEKENQNPCLPIKKPSSFFCYS